MFIYRLFIFARPYIDIIYLRSISTSASLCVRGYNYYDKFFFWTAVNNLG